jgi:urease accessory protein
MGRKAVALGLGLDWALFASGALAHTGIGAASGLSAGFAHPLSGLDHLLAMLAVGLWAGLVGGGALWAWPLAFIAVMVVGALGGASGVPAPGTEALIAVSLVVLGGAVALPVRSPVLAGAAICGVFAFFHGHAHGAELPADGSGLTYGAGFVLATAALHVLGVAAAVGSPRLAAAWLPRAAGAATVLAGAMLLIG